MSDYSADWSGLAIEFPKHSHDCLTDYRATCQRCVAHDETCGLRCDICDDRLCDFFGPEQATTCSAHRLCIDCEADNACRQCKQTREDVLADRRWEDHQDRIAAEQDERDDAIHEANRIDRNEFRDDSRLRGDLA